MKKFLSLVLAIAVLMGMTVAVSAEVESVSFGATVVEGKVGDIVTVDITISENHYMVNGQVRVQYDPEALELVPISDGVVANYNTAVLGANGMSMFNSPMVGRVNFAYVSSSDVGMATGGVMFSLQFKILEGAKSENAVTVTVPEFNSNDTGNGALDDYPDAIVKSGAVKLAGLRKKGDLTGEGTVDIADATTLFRAVNGRIVLTDEQKAVAELTDDDTVDIADATTLFRFVNGRILTLD